MNKAWYSTLDYIECTLQSRRNPMTTPNGPKTHTGMRVSWILLVVVGAVFALFGLSDLLWGVQADPAIAERLFGMTLEELQTAEPYLARLISLVSRALGLNLFRLAVLSLTIALTAIWRGEQWAWNALWIWLAWNACTFCLFLAADRNPDFPTPPPMLSSPMFCRHRACIGYAIG